MSSSGMINWAQLRIAGSWFLLWGLLYCDNHWLFLFMCGLWIVLWHLLHTGISELIIPQTHSLSFVEFRVPFV